ncbi:MAG TPA: hypothetical protein DCW83_07830 [Saprospirales bacterium]|jgi:hypothetical protein|nr:hypothetical protein [Saprospirales bacterium]
MYISHKYKLIFLRSPKTASSSLSEFFIKNIPDPDAIYTPVEDSNIKGTLSQDIINRYKTHFKFYHFTLQDIIDNNIITKEQALSYRSICVIRDPVDRQKSFYYFYKKWKQPGSQASIEQYNDWTSNGPFIGEPNSGILQSSFLKIDNKIVGEYWLYQNFHNDLSQLMRELDLSVTHMLPQHKTDFRKNRDNEIKFNEFATDNLNKFFGSDVKLYNELLEETYV